MKRFGLLGRKLSHSYSPQLHALLADYEYRLWEKEPEELDDFLRRGEFDGLNVTVPYKKAVLPYCRELSPLARRLGSVNTLLRLPGGGFWGGNTDYAGFSAMVDRLPVSPAGKRVLLFGSGGTSVTARAVLEDRGAEVITVSRSGPVTYGMLQNFRDARLLVNTTPLGTYPDVESAPVEPGEFPACEGVLDVVYNPVRTTLLLRAETLGIPRVGGLCMLTGQGVRSSERFLGHALPEGSALAAERTLRRSMENLILIGMPGCGKTTLGRRLAERLGRPFADADEELEKAVGLPIPEFIRRRGEAEFRRLETETLSALGRRSACVIAAGGGAVTREENYPHLHRNGTILWLRRELDALPTAGRPLSEAKGVFALWKEREPLYRRFSDAEFLNDGPIEETAEKIIRWYET